MFLFEEFRIEYILGEKEYRLSIEGSSMDYDDENLDWINCPHCGNTLYYSEERFFWPAYSLFETNPHQRSYQVGRKPVLIRITSISPIGFTPDLAPGTWSGGAEPESVVIVILEE